MTFLSDCRNMARFYARKGGKRYRSLQIKRLLKFAEFAQNRGIFEAGQVGTSTFEAFAKENNLKEKTVTAYRQAFEQLWKLGFQDSHSQLKRPK